MGAGHVFVCVTCAYMRDIWMQLRELQIDVSDAEIAISAQKSASAGSAPGVPPVLSWGLRRDLRWCVITTRVFSIFLLQFRYISGIVFFWDSSILQGTLNRR